MDTSYTTYLGQKGYTIDKSGIPDTTIETIKDELLVKPKTIPTAMTKPVEFPIYRESGKKLYVPRFYGIKKFGTPKQNKLSNGIDIDIEFNGSLRDYQQTIVDAYLSQAYSTGGGLIDVPCGAGKTVLALYILSQLKKKTLVIVHKEFLMNQWIERIQQYLPSARVGKLQGQTMDIEDKDIVIGMLQTLSMKDELTENDFKPFGFTIIDECFPAYTNIVTDQGIMTIGKIYDEYNNNGNRTIKALSYNETTQEFEYQTIENSWTSGEKRLIRVSYISMCSTSLEPSSFECTGNHKILTTRGYVCAEDLNEETPDILIGYDSLKRVSTYYEVVNIEPLVNIEQVYDITVRKNHNFLVSNGETNVVVHNCHHIGAEVFSRSLFKIVTKYMLGLSATMNRKDGLTHVFKKFIGDVAYKMEKREEQHSVTIKTLQYSHKDPDYADVVYNYMGNVHYSIMIRKLCEFNHRSEFILQVLEDEIKENPSQQIMILAHNKSLLKYLYDAIQHRGIGGGSVGYYLGGMKEQALKDTETKLIVIATYAMAEEALDIKTLSKLILATPKTDVTQAVGRILRMKHENPVVVDIVDCHDIFQKQYLKRRNFYMKCKYKIVQTTYEGYQTKQWKTIFEGGDDVKVKQYKKKIKDEEKMKQLRGQCFLQIE